MKKVLSVLLFAFAIIGVATVINVSPISQTTVEAYAYRQVEALHILVPTEIKAQEIRKEIMSGQNQTEIFNNFRKAAKMYSKCPSGADGGMLGWFGRGDMVPEFEKAAFALTPGEVSEPVKTQFGYHLIYILARK